jgi:putative transcriptional regulator
MQNRELRARRAKLGLTQRDMAHLLNITVSSYSRKENGKTGFSQKELEIMIDSLKLTAEEAVYIFLNKKLH